MPTLVSSMCPNSSSTGKVGCEREVNRGKEKEHVVLLNATKGREII